jgi:hypothetical protein
MKAKNTYKHHYAKRARTRVLNVEDKVLLLLPTDNDKIMFQWKVLNKFDYRIKIGDKLKTLHKKIIVMGFLKGLCINLFYCHICVFVTCGGCKKSPRTFYQIE